MSLHFSSSCKQQEMIKQREEIDWSNFANASPKPKRLHLEEDDSDGLFHCPVQDCNHDGFISQRGYRKHVKQKHCWFFYFDDKPETGNSEANRSPKNEAKDRKPAHMAKSIPTFDRSSPIVDEFLSWLTGNGGGCKSDRQAQQIVSRCLKF